MSVAAPVEDLRARPTAALIDYIVAHHHEYLREVLPHLQELAPEVARAGAARDPRLRDVELLVDDLVEALIPHLVTEEHLLFPAMTAPRPDRGLITRELASMQRDHRAVDVLLADLRAATDDLTPPTWASDGHRALLVELAELEADVRAHVALEDDVLAPRFSAR